MTMLTVAGCPNKVWVQESDAEIKNINELLDESIKEIKRLKKEKCNKYIVYDRFGEKYIIIDFDGEEINYKIITENELEGLNFTIDISDDEVRLLFFGFI